MSKLIKFDDGDGEDYPPHDSRSRRLPMESFISKAMEAAADESLRRIRRELDAKIMGLPVVDLGYVSGPVVFEVEPRVADIELDYDTPCNACGKLLREHTRDVTTDMGDVVPVRGGYAHRLCVLEEVEVVEIKSLPPGESHE